MNRPHGNGSGKFAIGRHNMGGWVRAVAGRHNLPNDLPVYLSQALLAWFRQRPQRQMRCVVPVQRDGNTVELHAWYEAHLFPPVQGPRPAPE
jgi:hypothetical protein